jgi:hypothetical protein
VRSRQDDVVGAGQVTIPQSVEIGGLTSPT